MHFGSEGVDDVAGKAARLQQFGETTQLGGGSSGGSNCVSVGGVARVG